LNEAIDLGLGGAVPETGPDGAARYSSVDAHGREDIRRLNFA
jgi:hypothetical protein